MPSNSFCLRLNILVVAAGIALLLTGCASPIQSKIPTTNDIFGMVYALPKGQVQFTASRKQITGDDIAAAREAAAAIAATLAADKNALTDAKKALTLAQGVLNSADPLAKDELAKSAAIAKAVVDYLTIRVSAETKSSAAAEQKAKELSSIEGKWVETASMTQLPSVADASRRFVAHLDHGFTRNDKMKISVAGGLLSTTSATSDDQSVAIILNLVQGAAAFSGAAVGPQLALRSFPLSKPKLVPDCQSYSFSSVFDPTNPTEVAQVNSDFLAKSPVVSFKVDAKQTNVTVTKATDNPDGLVYRAPRAVRMQIEAASTSNSPCKISGQIDAATLVVVVPDSSSEFVLGSRAGPFTKTVFDFAFKDGMPTDYSLEQPSELTAIASLPLDIAKAIVSVPASIIKLRVDYDSQANAKIDANTALLKARLAQLNAQQVLDAAKAKAADSDTP